MNDEYRDTTNNNSAPHTKHEVEPISSTVLHALGKIRDDIVYEWKFMCMKLSSLIIGGLREWHGSIQKNWSQSNVNTKILIALTAVSKNPMDKQILITARHTLAKHLETELLNLKFEGIPLDDFMHTSSHNTCSISRILEDASPQELLHDIMLKISSIHSTRSLIQLYLASAYKQVALLISTHPITKAYEIIKTRLPVLESTKTAYHKACSQMPAFNKQIFDTPENFFTVCNHRATGPLVYTWLNLQNTQALLDLAYMIHEYSLICTSNILTETNFNADIWKSIQDADAYNKLWDYTQQLQSTKNAMPDQGTLSRIFFAYLAMMRYTLNHRQEDYKEAVSHIVALKQHGHDIENIYSSNVKNIKEAILSVYIDDHESLDTKSFIFNNTFPELDAPFWLATDMTHEQNS